MLLMTEKLEKEIPEDEHGYWGGFSPDRVGTYKNQNLTKQFDDGRARLYPARKKSSHNYMDIPEEKSRHTDQLHTITSAKGTGTVESSKSSHIFINENGYNLRQSRGSQKVIKHRPK